jgi:uncharacterized phage infection (PIP) family protein YhgE
MALSRTTVVVALCSAVLLAGCGGSEPSSDPGPGGPIPTLSPTPDAAVAWADDVCSASTELQTSLRQVGESLHIDPSASATSLDQARAQVSDRVTAVQQSATSLNTALTAAPAGADPQLAEAQQQLQTASQRAQTGVDHLGEVAGELAKAQTANQVATGLVTLTTAFTAAAADVGTYLDSLRGMVGSREQAIQKAFGAAPACTNLAPSPSPSTSD